MEFYKRLWNARKEEEMLGLFNYYRMKTNEDDEVVFQKVKEEDITIMGKSIEEVIRILKGLELERITQIEMTMGNLERYYKFIIDDQEKTVEESLKRLRQQFNMKE